MLHIRLRKGSANTSRGMLRFFDELIARVERAGATGPKLLRADSGFWSNKTFARLERAGWQFSIGVRLQPAVRAAIDAIHETRVAHARGLPADERSRRSPRPRSATAGWSSAASARSDRQGELLPTWELFPFVTNRTDTLATVEAEHRQHAVVELAIRDLKDQALAHFPSGQFFANAAWTVIAASRTTCCAGPRVIGLPGQTIRTARTLRRRLLTLPGRLTRTARRWTLHLPARWPWQHAFAEALARIRALRPPPDRAATASKTNGRPARLHAVITAARKRPKTPPRKRLHATTDTPHDRDGYADPSFPRTKQARTATRAASVD